MEELQASAGAGSVPVPLPHSWKAPAMRSLLVSMRSASTAAGVPRVVIGAFSRPIGP
jgi:hypothetical protein